MQDQTIQQSVGSVYKQSGHPGSRFVFFLSLCSIACVWLYGIVGLILGVYALKLAKKALSAHKQLEFQYSEKSLKLLKASRIYSSIGIILSSVYLLMFFIKIIA